MLFRTQYFISLSNRIGPVINHVCAAHHYTLLLCALWTDEKYRIVRSPDFELVRPGLVCDGSSSEERNHLHYWGG